MAEKSKRNVLLNESELISLLAIYYNNISTINNLFTTYMSVFIGGIFVVLGACVLGITSSLSLGIETLLVCMGSLMAILLSIGLRRMVYRSIKHSLENIAKVVILEEKLGLDSIEIYNSKDWPNDSLVMKDHILERKNTGTIKNFIEQRHDKGQFKNVKFITNSIIGISSVIFAFEVIRFVHYLIANLIHKIIMMF
ncbi:MAG: hypothetical protein JXN65_09150 [Clostridia bacterium]|nr:hypothetical protein [Clostridia bacterium]